MAVTAAWLARNHRRYTQINPPVTWTHPNNTGLMRLADHNTMSMLEHTEGTVVMAGYVPAFHINGNIQDKMTSVGLYAGNETNLAKHGATAPIFSGLLNLKSAGWSRYWLGVRNAKTTADLQRMLNDDMYRYWVFTDTEPTPPGSPPSPPRSTGLRPYLWGLWHGRHRRWGGKYVKELRHKPMRVSDRRPMKGAETPMDVFLATVEANKPILKDASVEEVQEMMSKAVITQPVLFVEDGMPSLGGVMKTFWNVADMNWDLDWRVVTVTDGFAAAQEAFGVTEPCLALIRPEHLQNHFEAPIIKLSLASAQGVDEVAIDDHIQNNIITHVSRVEDKYVGRFLHGLGEPGSIELQILTRNSTNAAFSEIANEVGRFAREKKDITVKVVPVSRDLTTLMHLKEKYRFNNDDPFFRNAAEDDSARVVLAQTNVRIGREPNRVIPMLEPFSEAAVRNHLEAALQGKVTGRYKTWPPFATVAPGEVQQLVSDDFEQRVFGSREDFFVMLHNPRIPQSAAVIPEWEKLAAKKIPGVVIAQFDVERNEFPDRMLHAQAMVLAEIKRRQENGENTANGILPLMLYYKEGHKSAPVTYIGESSLAWWEDFIKKRPMADDCFVASHSGQLPSKFCVPYVPVPGSEVVGTPSDPK